MAPFSSSTPFSSICHAALYPPKGLVTNSPPRAPTGVRDTSACFEPPSSWS